MLMLLSAHGERLICAAVAGELSDVELDEVFDEFGVSTRTQLVALAQARGWIDQHGDPPITEAQREYLRTFDAWLRDPSLEKMGRRLMMLRRIRRGG